MSLSSDEISRRLRTEVFDFNEREKAPVIDFRRKRIQEAVAWEGGPSTESPERIVVDELPSGAEAYFLKPGKEADREDPNPHDMTPGVDDLYEGYKFQDIWALLARCSVVDFECFEFLLVLIYRSTYLVDHEEVDEGTVRYNPAPEVQECIDYIDDKVGHVVPGGVNELLHFLDLLGWNEDVKYQGPSGSYEMSSSFNTGRINTMLTAVKIPYKLSQFANHILEHSDSPEEINFSEGLETMQDLTMSRGTSTPANYKLVEWFHPTIHEHDETTLEDFD